ncbi:MAG: TolC family protein [Kiritimatiellae bacterium]|nr:TolC family protein [Kiritimatiellia bacterium]
MPVVRHLSSVVCLLVVGGLLLTVGIGMAAEEFIGPSRSLATNGVTNATVNNVVLSPDGKIEISIQDAILLALENNRALAVQRLQPTIKRTFESQERAVFDPLLDVQLSQNATRYQQVSSSSDQVQELYDRTTYGNLQLSEYLPTGSRIAIMGTTTLDEPPLYADHFDSTRGGISLTQSLLKGGSIAANLASLHQARLDTSISEYELRGFAQQLVADVEVTYWNYTLAWSQIRIFTDSLKLADNQLTETEERIKVGKLAKLELYAAQAEVASRKEALINANSAMENNRLLMIRLINLPDRTNFWNRGLIMKNQPFVPEGELEDVAAHVATAQKMRPDLNQARLQVQRGDLEVVKTRNGLLPQMDLFVALGETGYADSFSRSVQNVNADHYDTTVGLQFEFPPLNRDARARNRRAELSRSSAKQALDNLEQLAELDVRTAYIEVQRAREQVAATAVTRQLQEKSLQAEQEKFRVGKSTSLLVAQAERNLLVSQIAEIEAVVSYLKAFVALYRLEGSLLDRRGIDAPGKNTVVFHED